MPNAREPKAPWAKWETVSQKRPCDEKHVLDVCESPHTQVMPGKVKPCSGPITCTMPV
jgi:hypothetical protein